MSKTWFDPHNLDHCKAYRYLQETGAWPEGFELLDTEWFKGGIWQVAIMGKLANTWIDHILGGDSCPVLRKMEAK